MNEGALSGELGLAGWPAVAEESIIARDVLLAEHVGSPPARLPRLHRRLGRGHPLGEGPRHRRHRRGHPAPPAAHRGARRAATTPRFKVNPPLRRAEDVEALRAGPRRRHDRHRRDRPRPAPGRGEGVRVGRRGQRHGRASSQRPARRARRDGRDRPASTGRMSRACCRAAPARIGRLAGHGTPLAAGAPAELTLYDPRRGRPFSTRPTSPAAASTRPTSAASLPGRVRRDVPPRLRRRCSTARCATPPTRSRGMPRDGGGCPWISRPGLLVAVVIVAASHGSWALVAASHAARRGALGRTRCRRPPRLARRSRPRCSTSRRPPPASRSSASPCRASRFRGRARIDGRRAEASCSTSPGEPRASSRRPRSSAPAQATVAIDRVRRARRPRRRHLDRIGATRRRRRRRQLLPGPVRRRLGAHHRRRQRHRRRARRAAARTGERGLG